MPDFRTGARAAALVVVAWTAACGSTTPASAPTTSATTPIASAAPTPSAQPAAVPGAEEALAFLDKSYRDCEAYVLKNHLTPLGYPDRAAFQFTVLAVGPRPQIPAEGHPSPFSDEVEPALSAHQFLVRTGASRLLIVDLDKHTITGAQGPEGETVAPSCPTDVFPGAWD